MAVCKHFDPLIISIYIYGVHYGKVLILKNLPEWKKIINMSPQEDIHAHYIEDITSLSTLLWLGSKFSSGTLPTMHSIYLYTDMYQGLKLFANSCIYTCIYRVKPVLGGPVSSGHPLFSGQMSKFRKFTQ